MRVREKDLTRRKPGAKNSIAVTGREYCTPDMSIPERIEHIGWTVTAGGCWEWNGALSSTGYGTIKVRPKTVTLPRWTLEQKLGRPLQKGEVTRHRCDNRACINPEHLEPGSVSDNARDAVSRGRHKHWDGAPGVARPYLRKFTDEQVEEIIAARASGALLRTIALEYDSAISTIHGICNGRSGRVSSK